MKVMWWEKTVEYQFVLDTSKRRSGGLLTPFDGNHEQAGDAIFADTSNRWLLIEFKRDERQLDSEVIKFHDYRLAADELGADDAHHQLAFGLLDSESKLTLAFCTYFSRQAIEGIESALNLGTTHAILKAYVARLIELKRGPGGGDGPGGAAPQSFELF